MLTLLVFIFIIDYFFVCLTTIAKFVYGHQHSEPGEM